jgi:hypothetical protein
MVDDGLAMLDEIGSHKFKSPEPYRVLQVVSGDQINLVNSFTAKIPPREPHGTNRNARPLMR